MLKELLRTLLWPTERDRRLADFMQSRAEDQKRREKTDKAQRKREYLQTINE